jgi:hypothetical protein
VGEREFEVLGNELLDVWTLDIVDAVELDHTEDLTSSSSAKLPVEKGVKEKKHTWIDLNRAR